jgi:hypothetical protein
MAQIERAILLARAIATSMRGLRPSMRYSQVPSRAPFRQAQRTMTIAPVITKALNRSWERQEAAEALRSLIDRIELTPGPERGEVYATLHGELSTILNWAERQAIGKAPNTNTPGATPAGVSVSVVAGA